MTKILLLAANPKDTQRLRLGREISAIKEELRNASYGHQFDFESEEAARLIQLSEILRRVQPDIVHFSGHGSQAAEIILEDDAGNAQPVSEAALKEIFHQLRGNIRCVVLNACYTEHQANALAEEIDCVVGMLDQIEEKSAITFATEFYRQLASGANVSKAFRLGRAHITQGRDLARLLVYNVNPSKVVFTKQRAWLKYGVLTTLVVVLLAAAIWFIPLLLPQPNLRINPKDNAVYAWVPPGAFTMGSSITDTSAHINERPQHEVILDGFWIMQTEVTNIQYKRCVAANVCSPPNDERWSDPAYAQHPVVNITWDDANTYATWVGGRLPTEAEWEKACRGTDAQIYPWGNQDPTPQRLNYQGSNKGGTLPVGSYPPGAHGLHDMAGNVFELVADWYDEQYYVNSLTANPKGPANGTHHTIRGGSFVPDANFLNFLRCAARGTDSTNPTIGFRVASDGF